MFVINEIDKIRRIIGESHHTKSQSSNLHFQAETIIIHHNGNSLRAVTRVVIYAAEFY